MFPIQFRGAQLPPPTQGWKTKAIGMERAAKANRLNPSGASVRYKVYLRDYPVQAISNNWSSFVGESSNTYVVQTASRVVERCLLMTTDPGDLVVDPTCGGGTTAFVSEKWGRRWITCDTSRVAITLAKQRLMTASFDYYALRYPHEGLKGGFDYETVPHITLKSIANNPDIDTIYDEDHPKIAAALVDLNAALKSAPPLPIKLTQGYRKGKQASFRDGDSLEEWEVPFDPPEGWPQAAKAPFEAFHTARQAMQRRMDQSISDHAEQETLYDKPRIDRNKLRITGPFSVEAVRAPTVLSLDESLPAEEADSTVARSGETSRQSLWRDELLKTGVRGKGGNMMRLAEFEVIPGTRFLHASGSVADTGERVVVSFGPEHAGLEQRQIEEAINEAYTLMPNPARASQDSLGVAYEEAGGNRMVRPDFVFFVQIEDGSIAADLIDPHGDHLADALPKLKGLAKYAAENLATFRRIEAITKLKKTGAYRMLDLTKEDVKKAVKAATSAEGLYGSTAAEDYVA